MTARPRAAPVMEDRSVVAVLAGVGAVRRARARPASLPPPRRTAVSTRTYGATLIMKVKNSYDAGPSPHLRGNPLSLGPGA